MLIKQKILIKSDNILLIPETFDSLAIERETETREIDRGRVIVSTKYFVIFHMRSINYGSALNNSLIF